MVLPVTSSVLLADWFGVGGGHGVASVFTVHVVRVLRAAWGVVR